MSVASSSKTLLRSVRRGSAATVLCRAIAAHFDANVSFVAAVAAYFVAHALLSFCSALTLFTAFTLLFFANRLRSKSK